MAKPTLKNLKKALLLFYIGVFPFGQIPSLIATVLFHKDFGVHLGDILVTSYVLVSVLSNPPYISKVLDTRLGKAIFILGMSLISGLVLLNLFDSHAFFYFIRLSLYLSFSYLLYIEKPLTKVEAAVSLLTVGLVVSLIGLFQYSVFPDLRQLKTFGWDDHYYRLTFPFLDPAFTGMILVFSTLFAFFQKTKYPRFQIIVGIISCISLLFTYSRASYLAFIIGLLLYAARQSNKAKTVLAFLMVLGVSVLLLPRPGGEGVRLERTFSIFLKIENYKETIDIWKLSPVLGVGYNNICNARGVLLPVNRTELYNHSCTGADNSFLLILATTGLIGIIFLLKTTTEFLHRNNNTLLYVLCAALFVHAQFTNTLLYTWVIGWIALYLGSALSSTEKK